MSTPLRIISRAEVASLLTFYDYVCEVEAAFRQHAEGRSLAPQLMHVEAPDGEFHVKGGGLRRDRWYFALKANGSFFGNPARHGLPAIQGVIVLFDGETGSPLALIDSLEITVQRTGAATALAARHLARRDSRVATICGCGKQGRVHVAAICEELPIERVFLWDREPGAARILAADVIRTGAPRVEPADDLHAAISSSDVVVTCTPSRTSFVALEWVRPGTFLAAVGADSPGKQELDARLIAPPAKLVVDLLDQAASVGELQHALAAGLCRREDVYAELGEIIAGYKPGRVSDEETIVFDATGTALQDVAAAAAVYERALAVGAGVEVRLS